VRIWINGAAHDLDGAPAVADALSAAGLPERGVAVAVDGEVVPRARWADTALAEGARLEVLTAVQGG
jgi:sulfur carrier protein